jgi:CRP-like cAMP-binding protein
MPGELRRWVDVTERAIYLRSIPVAAMLSPALVHVIASQLRERRLPKDTCLMREGDDIASLLLLVDGSVRLVKGGRQIGTLAPPQTLGFLGIIGRSPAGYDAFAESDVHALELESDTIYELLEEQFQFMVATLRYAAERVLYEMQELPEDTLGIPFEKIPFQIGERPLDFVEKILLLRQIGVFRKTNLNALAALSQQMEEIRFAPGEVIWKPGDPAPFGLMVADGEATCHTEDGRRFVYGPGTAMGGVEGLAGKPRWYTATAQTRVVGLRGVTDELLDVIEDNYELGMDFVSMMANGLSGLLARKAAMGQSISAQKRDVSKLGAIPVGA